MDVIKSLENDRVKYWNKLNQKKYRDEENLFLIEGEHLVQEAIKNNKVKELIVQNNYAINTDIKVNYVTNEILNKISNLESAPKIIAVCEKLQEQELTDKILIIDALQDPGNLGTIIRSAVAFNFKTIVLGDNTVDLYNDKVIKATEGMLFNINILKRKLFKFIPTLNDYKIYGTKLTTGINLSEIKENKVAVIIGNEGNGMNPLLEQFCHNFINIPINKTCESINASIAASIIMYELGDLNE